MRFKLQNAPIGEYLCASPKKLYGDDFSLSQIEEWFAEEENGYANLGYIDSETDFYPYHALNSRHGWNALPSDLGKVLSLGGAFAAEFEHVTPRMQSLTVVEPGRKFWRDTVYGVKAQYLSPNPQGTLDFPDGHFDTITAFGVLHHIPNVTYVVRELARVLKPGGFLLMREPIISMGDWRHARTGLTKNERGIPVQIIDALVAESRFSVVKKSFVMFTPLQKIGGALRLGLYTSPFWTGVDDVLCRLFQKNYKYHRTSTFDRFSGTSMFLTLRK